MAQVSNEAAGTTNPHQQGDHSMTKQKPMTGTQARILHTLADQLATYDNPQAKERAAGIRGRLALTPRISHETARALATNAAIHIQELDLTLRAAKRREDARS